MTLSRWLFLTIPGFVLAAVLLALTIRSLLRTLSGAVVAAVPLEEHQSFPLAEPGPYDLYVEGRLGTMDFVGLGFRLTDAAGRNVPMSGVLFRARVNSLSRARLLLQSFQATAPGVFALEVTGLRSAASPDDRIVISRPVRGALVTHILGLVILGGLTIGSMVASGLLLFGPQR
jgi:hypothetical protein